MNAREFAKTWVLPADKTLDDADYEFAEAYAATFRAELNAIVVAGIEHRGTQTQCRYCGRVGHYMNATNSFTSIQHDGICTLAWAERLLAK